MQEGLEKSGRSSVLACVVLASVAAAGSGLVSGQEGTLPITVMNYTTLPVHATAIALDEQAISTKLGLPLGAPLRVRSSDKGTSIPLARGTENGRPVIWLHVTLRPTSRLDLVAERAERLRLAQEIVLPVCRFPIVDTWFAQVPHFGGGEDRRGYRARNDSVGAVEEMECVARSGFLKYSPVAVLLEPDLYDLHNQQGWWDDEHWQRGPNNRAKGVGSWVSSHGQFVPPYETARKWAGAVKALGGIPMIYVQTGFRSQDYAESFPSHMLFNEPNAPHVNEKGEQLYRDKERKQPRKLGYDYTDPGFQKHLREVWENLRLAGIQGVKFDYPDFPFTGWPTRGGMEDAYATTAMHYRNVFRWPSSMTRSRGAWPHRGRGRPSPRLPSNFARSPATPGWPS